MQIQQVSSTAPARGSHPTLFSNQAPVPEVRALPPQASSLRSLQRQPVHQNSCITRFIQKLAHVWSRICNWCSARVKPRVAPSVSNTRAPAAPAQSTSEYVIQILTPMFSPRSTVNPQDQQIRDIFASEQHQNVVIEYKWKGQSYPVRIINNRSTIVVFDTSRISERYIVSTKEKAANLPEGLAKHLRQLIPAVAQKKDLMLLFGTQLAGKSIFDALEGK